MLQKSNRLTSNFEFNVARKYGTRYSSNLCHIYVLKAKDYQGPARIGIVISTKFHKNAVVRNRVKRLYREVVREHLKKLSPGLWVVIHPKFICLEKNYEEISTDFNQLLQKVSFA